MLSNTEHAVQTLTTNFGLLPSKVLKVLGREYARQTRRPVLTTDNEFRLVAKLKAGRINKCNEQHIGYDLRIHLSKCNEYDMGTTHVMMGALATLAGGYTGHEGGWEEVEAVMDLASSLAGPGCIVHGVVQHVL